MDKIREHPARSALLATPVMLFAICGAIAQSWQSFTDKKIPDWFSQNFGWVFMKFSIWQIWGFIASIVAVYCLIVYFLFRPRRPKFGSPEYVELLADLAEKKRQKASQDSAYLIGPKRVITEHRRSPMDRILQQVDQANAANRARAAERARQQAECDEVLDRVGELIRERRSRNPSGFTVRQNIFGLLIQAGVHRLKREDDVVAVCNGIVAAGNEHPFVMFDKESSPVERGEWLEFVKAFHLSGRPFEDTSGWDFAVTQWRGKDRWLNRHRNPMREIQGSTLVMRAPNASYEALWKFINAGDEMLVRLRENREPLPTEEEVKAWSADLIALAGTCASVAEVERLRNSKRSISTEETVDNKLEVPHERWGMVEELFGKAKVAREIATRIYRDDNG